MFFKEDHLFEKSLERGITPAAGYTYIGQFIVHDLTFDDTPFRAAGFAEPEETINYRTPRLDLESLYGDGPGFTAHSHLYDGEAFCLGNTVSSISGALLPFDVPFLRGRPSTADDRNCENAIVRQVHAMFLLLHNLILRNLRSEPSASGQLFERARSSVRWHFQWLVRNDFLKKLCRPDVYRQVISSTGQRIRWPWGKFSIPVEFSQAAGRFGHSMAKKDYHLRDPGIPAHIPAIPLVNLFLSATDKTPLPDNYAVHWGYFLRGGEQAAKIDTFLVDPMQNLPDQTIHPFVSSPIPHEPRILPFRTLVRGARTRLPTGQQLRVALDPQAVVTENGAWNNLRSVGLENEIPLWYYILLEAQIMESGNQLGKIGSRVVAEVIEAALRHDPSSFLYHEGGNWAPPPLLWADGKTKSPITSFMELAMAVGLLN
ncbi:MAG TPA: peroxidase family protein [Chthoniobacterales bacterium]|nr:peroxidase family protein [Chthoniobacterales bacterium]